MTTPRWDVTVEVTDKDGDEDLDVYTVEADTKDLAATTALSDAEADRPDATDFDVVSVDHADDEI